MSLEELANIELEKLKKIGQYFWILESEFYEGRNFKVIFRNSKILSNQSISGQIDMEWNNQIYNSIPKELARVNNTFKYSIVDKNARKVRYVSSLDWLLASNMILKCDLTEKNESPFKAFVNSNKFKLYLSDVGLLRSLSNLNYNEIILEKNEMYKGVLTENYIACELYPQAI